MKVRVAVRLVIPTSVHIDLHTTDPIDSNDCWKKLHIGRRRRFTTSDRSHAPARFVLAYSSFGKESRTRSSPYTTFSYLFFLSEKRIS